MKIWFPAEGGEPYKTKLPGAVEGSEVLYGVAMQGEGVSKLFKLKTEEAAEFSF